MHTKLLLEEMQESFESNIMRMCEHRDLVNPFNISVMTILLTFDTRFEASELSQLSQAGGKSFHNQVSVKGLDAETGSRYCVKLFRNGKMHITGCKSMARALMVADQILRQVKPGCDHLLLDTDIEMLNMDFQASMPLNLKALVDTLEEEELPVSYNPISYPGAKLQLGFCTVLCFSSGSVIVTGARSIEAARRGYDIFCHILDRHRDRLVMPSREQKRSKRRRTQEATPDIEVYRPLLESGSGIAFSDAVL